MGFRNIPKMVLACPNETNFRPRVESFPVIGHTPITSERHACNVFRDDEHVIKSGEAQANSWYSEHWMER